MTAVRAGVAAATLMAASAAWAAEPPELMPAFPASAERAAVTQWLRERAALPVGVPVELGPDSAVAILTDSVEGRAVGVHAVSFREEAIDIGYVIRNGGRSLSGEGDVNCTARTIRLENLRIFVGSGLRGDRITDFPAQTAYRQPSAGSVLDRVIQTVCYVAPPPPGPRQAYVSPPVPARPAPAAPVAASPPAPVAVPGPPATPPPGALAFVTPPPPVAAAPTEPPIRLESATPARVVPAPESDPALAPVPSAAPDGLRRLAAAPPAAPVEEFVLPPSPPSSVAQVGTARERSGLIRDGFDPGKVVVQIGAFSREAQAAAAFRPLAAIFLEDYSKRYQVVAATVNGVQLYRAEVAGFRDQGEATVFCAQLRSKGRSCLVRTPG